MEAKEKEVILVSISLSLGETLKCNRCGVYLINQIVNLRIAREEAVIEVICEKCMRQRSNE